MLAAVVFDSWADFLAIEGLNENDSVDVTRWVKKVVYPLRDLGAATLLLDHVTKDGKGRGGRGTTAKLNKLDAGFKVSQLRPFDRNQIGRIILYHDKDREAALERSVAFRVGGDGTGRVICHREGGVRLIVDDLTDNQRKVFLALSHGGMRSGEWEEASGMGKSSFQFVRKALVEEKGLVKQADDGRYYPTTKMMPAGSVAERA